MAALQLWNSNGQLGCAISLRARLILAKTRANVLSGGPPLFVSVHADGEAMSVKLMPMNAKLAITTTVPHLKVGCACKCVWYPALFG